MACNQIPICSIMNGIKNSSDVVKCIKLLIVFTDVIVETELEI